MNARTLLITNDFPPRRGGIETFCHELAARMARTGVVVYTSRSPGAAAFDATLPFPVLRDPAATLLPTPAVARRASGLLAEFDCTRVVFGAAAPLGLLAGRMRAAGARRVLAISHGHELWWARLPGSRHLLRRIAADVDVLTYLGAYTRRGLLPAVHPADRDRLARLVPGVDPATFHPGVDGASVRARYGLGADPVVLFASRLVRRKGADTLIRALAPLRRRFPRLRLLVVGDGPDAARLGRLARRAGVAERVHFAGSHPHAELPRFYAAADVFAVPCRTRRGGLEPEALGIVFLEAAASGLPVLVGDSGGAPETVRHGETGYVVDGRDPHDVAARLATLLTDPERARAMGRRGRERVLAEWTWERTTARLAELAAPDTPAAPE